ncbi:DNA glycosylase AlkZ-like family protein [Sphaerisporangium perillae]|uniref:DNA glycosylase AlkZ-like family protein n=1 Tax=Sphaerisporangium perillae TaxID=2935860 RepID=UPI00200C5188|nr:crosslink repair DNA glycosylase YcaQ family protein [Sphaerisporangium perillae]
MTAVPVVSRRVLNRTLLERQPLITRTSRSALEVVRHLVAMQGQEPNWPYVGLWTRSAGFRHEDLTSLLNERGVLPVVHAPSVGAWGGWGSPAGISVTLAEAWIGGPIPASPPIELMIHRYLAAFGPAGVMDIQAWSGLTRLRTVIDTLRPRLRILRDEISPFRPPSAVDTAAVLEEAERLHAFVVPDATGPDIELSSP